MPDLRSEICHLGENAIKLLPHQGMGSEEWRAKGQLALGLQSERGQAFHLIW